MAGLSLAHASGIPIASPLYSFVSLISVIMLGLGFLFR